MRNITMPLTRQVLKGKILFSLCSLISFPICAESIEDTIESTEYQNRDYYNLNLLASGPSYLRLPAPPLPPLPRAPRPYEPRRYGQKVFRQGASFYGGWSTGGDSLRTYNGSQLNAGDGTSVHFGWNADFQTGPARTALQWAIGYRWSELDFKDDLGRSGTAKMSVIPLDMLAYFQQGHFRIGGGFTYHLFPHYSEEIKDSIFDSTKKIDFNNQLGFTASMELVGIRAPFFINLRYTYIVYKPEGGSYLDSQTNERISEVNGSNFSINAGLHIR